MLADIKISFERDTGCYKAVMLKDGQRFAYAGKTAKEALAELVEGAELITPDVILTDMADLTILRGVLSLFGETIYRITWEL